MAKPRQKAPICKVTSHVVGAKEADGSGNDPLIARFIQAMARRGVPELGARAALRQLRDLAKKTRTGQLEDTEAHLKMALVLIDVETKAAELNRARGVEAARDVHAGRVSLVDARQRLTGAA